MAYPDWPATLNPVTEASPGAHDILRAVLPSFYVITPALEYRRWLLAEEPVVRTSGHRMEVAFRLREDARWSDGIPITVADVAFTVEVMQDPRIDAGNPEGFDRVVEVVAEAPDRGRLVLSPPLPAWRDLFSAGRFVLPAHAADSPLDVEAWNDGPPVAGGPFLVRNVLEGRSVMLGRNPRYWGSGPALRGIEVLAVPDPTTALQLLRDGRVDVVAPMLGVSWGHRLDRLDGVRWTGTFGTDLVAMVANTARLADPVDRRTLAGAIDRTRFAQAVIREEGRLAEGLLPAGTGDAIPRWKRPPADLEGEISIEEEVQLVYVRTELLELTARYLQAEVERAGGDLELVGLESDVFWRTFLPARRFDLALIEVRGSPAADVGEWVGPPDGIWSSLTGLRLPSDASPAQTQGAVARLAAALPLYELRTAMGWRAGVTGIAPNPSADGPLWNAEAWALAEV